MLKDEEGREHQICEGSHNNYLTVFPGHIRHAEGSEPPVSTSRLDSESIEGAIADSEIASEAAPLLPPAVPLVASIKRALEEIDLEAGVDSDAFCRICLESGGTEDELICPCQCKGTQQYVHRSCLDYWRAVKEGFAFSHCTTCKAQFHLRPNIPNDYSWRQRKFQLFVTRDVCLVFLAVQLTVLLLALLVAVVDINQDLLHSSSWATLHPHLFYYCWGLFVFLVLFGIGGFTFHCLYGSQVEMGPCGGACAGNCGSELAMGAGCGELLLVAIVIFALLGAFYGVLAAMVAWQRIWQRHYHILAKKVLAEEYIVEDLHGEYTLPKLAAQDEERLKSLGLL